MAFRGTSQSQAERGAPPTPALEAGPAVASPLTPVMFTGVTSQQLTQLPRPSGLAGQRCPSGLASGPSSPAPRILPSAPRVPVLGACLRLVEGARGPLRPDEGGHFHCRCTRARSCRRKPIGLVLSVTVTAALGAASLQNSTLILT